MEDEGVKVVLILYPKVLQKKNFCWSLEMGYGSYRRVNKGALNLLVGEETNSSFAIVKDLEVLEIGQQCKISYETYIAL